MTGCRRHYPDLSENPRGYCPNQSTGVKLPDDFVVTPLQYVDWRPPSWRHMRDAWLSWCGASSASFDISHIDKSHNACNR
jgi:hypothetical protein